MNIINMATKELVPYENNPRRNEGAIEAVAQSIKAFGFKVPVIIDAQNVIVCGHTRLKAAERLGLASIPCIRADDLSAEQIKAFRLADNKTAELSEWDFAKLEQELAAIELDMTDFGFTLPKDELKEDNFDLAAALEEIIEPMTQPGEVWQLGAHRLYCGDSTLANSYRRLLGEKKARLIITDPPYNVDYTGSNNKKLLNDNLPEKLFRNFLTDAFKQMYLVASPGAPIYVFHADAEYGYHFRGAFSDAGFKLAQNLIWIKHSLVMGRQDYQWRHEPILYGWKEGAAHFWAGDRDKDTVIEEEKISFGKAKKEDLIKIIKDLQSRLYAGTTTIYEDRPSISSEHPTMKPVRLLGKLIYNSSQPEALVLDPFGGSGSTLIACEQTGRICHTIELDPRYCDVIIKRFEDFTGQKATREI